MPRRPRRPGNRTKGGRPALPRDPVVTTELLDHRARMAPGIPTEDLMKQRAGIPIEILAAMPCPDRADGRNAIGEAHRLAGEQYAELVQRWRRLHQVPDDTRQRAGVGRGDDVDPSHVQTVDARMAEVQSALDKLPPFARAVTESICVDEFMGRVVDRTPIGAKMRAGLREGLDALCGVFRVASRRAA
jgi:hypothetical protein